jgi:hypothetical protein
VEGTPPGSLVGNTARSGIRWIALWITRDSPNDSGLAAGIKHALRRVGRAVSNERAALSRRSPGLGGITADSIGTINPVVATSVLATTAGELSDLASLGNAEDTRVAGLIAADVALVAVVIGNWKDLSLHHPVLIILILLFVAAAFLGWQVFVRSGLGPNVVEITRDLIDAAPGASPTKEGVDLILLLISLTTLEENAHHLERRVHFTRIAFILLVVTGLAWGIMIWL